MKKIVFLIITMFSVSALAAQEIDKSKSEFKWNAKKIAGEHYGKVPIKSGSLEINKKGKIKSGQIILDLTGFTVEDIKGGKAKKFIGHMKSEDFFDVEKYPEARFNIKKVVKNKIKGDLTIKGKTHAIEFPYNKRGDVYTGTMVFDRTKFGMVYKSKNFFKNLGDRVIHDDVTVDFKVVVKK